MNPTTRAPLPKLRDSKAFEVANLFNVRNLPSIISMLDVRNA